MLLDVLLLLLCRLHLLLLLRHRGRKNREAEQKKLAGGRERQWVLVFG